MSVQTVLKFRSKGEMYILVKQIKLRFTHFVSMLLEESGFPSTSVTLIVL